MNDNESGGGSKTAQQTPAETQASARLDRARPLAAAARNADPGEMLQSTARAQAMPCSQPAPGRPCETTDERHRHPQAGVGSGNLVQGRNIAISWTPPRGESAVEPRLLLTSDRKDMRLQGEDRRAIVEPRRSVHIGDRFPETTLLCVCHSLESQGERVGFELEALSRELDGFVVLPREQQQTRGNGVGAFDTGIKLDGPPDLRHGLRMLSLRRQVPRVVQTCRRQGRIQLERCEAAPALPQGRPSGSTRWMKPSAACASARPSSRRIAISAACFAFGMASRGGR